MTIVLQNATLSGNTARAEDTANLSFTKVMLRTDPDLGSDMDSFDFKTSESATEMHYEMKDALLSSWSLGASAGGTYDNDGVVDAADYVVWRKAVAADTTDLSLSAAVDTGVPVSMPEYGLFLF